MEMTVAYHGRSGIRTDAAGHAVSLAPNLRRDRVSFAADLLQPVRFREAMSALHDVVVSDLRYKQRDKSAYESWKAEQRKREAVIYSTVSQQARADFLRQQTKAIPEGLEERFARLRKVYWDARLTYSDHLTRTNLSLWRMLVPCDPVITVAPDVLFFECFSVDESSYGCLTVSRDAFRANRDVAPGTTNVDYSWNLYEEFQKLRSYRATRFAVDPAGFEVRTNDEAYHEEKIDLPPAWLRGFFQLQAAMSLPMRRVPVSREGLYNVLAWLKRHRAARSPRAVRFELEPGKPVNLVLEPWEKRIVLHDSPYSGKQPETIRTWGRDRLRLLARLLPLAEGADVYLLGTGLPSFWSVNMGEMRLLLGLSGWTANDWTGGSALDQLAAPVEPDSDLLRAVAAAFVESPSRTFADVRRITARKDAAVAVGLNKLAQLGQLIHDLSAGVYRWRQIMPTGLSLDELGRDSPETVAGRQLVEQKQVRVDRDERTASGLRVIAGRVPHAAAEAVLNGDGRMVRGKCGCSHHHKFGLRRGPCRHLQALRRAADGDRPTHNLDTWFRRLWN